MNCDYVRIFLFKFFVSKSSRHRAPAAFQRSHLISDWNTTGTETSRAPTTAPTRQSDLCLFLFWAVLALVKNSCSVLLFFLSFPLLRIFTIKKLGHFYPLAVWRKSIHAFISPSLDTAALLRPASVKSCSRCLCLNSILGEVLVLRPTSLRLSFRLRFLVPLLYLQLLPLFTVSGSSLGLVVLEVSSC